MVTLSGITTIGDAEALAGCELRIPEVDQQPLPADTYYQHSLVGCDVRSLTDESVGRVVAVQGVRGAQRLVVLSNDTEDEVEIPFADAICVRVDLERRMVVVTRRRGC